MELQKSNRNGSSFFDGALSLALTRFLEHVSVHCMFICRAVPMSSPFLLNEANAFHLLGIFIDKTHLESGTGSDHLSTEEKKWVGKLGFGRRRMKILKADLNRWWSVGRLYMTITLPLFKFLPVMTHSPFQQITGQCCCTLYWVTVHLR